jgi:hypothetical protein
MMTIAARAAIHAACFVTIVAAQRSPNCTRYEKKRKIGRNAMINST